MALDRFGLTMDARDDPSERVGGRTFDWKSEHKQHMSSRRWMDGSFCNHFAGLFRDWIPLTFKLKINNTMQSVFSSSRKQNNTKQIRSAWMSTRHSHNTQQIFADGQRSTINLVFTILQHNAKRLMEFRRNNNSFRGFCRRYNVQVNVWYSFAYSFSWMNFEWIKLNSTQSHICKWESNYVEPKWINSLMIDKVVKLNMISFRIRLCSELFRVSKTAENHSVRSLACLVIASTTSYV